MINISQFQSQGLKQIQRPQLIQYYRLLQVPQQNLELRIQQELEQNPLLELSDEETQIQEEEQQMELLQEEPDNEKNDDEFDFEDFYDDDTGGYKSPDSMNDEDEVEYVQPETKSLIDSLFDQLRLLNLSEEEFVLAEEIIGNIDEDGYLRRSLQEILDDVNSLYKFSLTFEQANKVLFTIQTLDPPGIGSRTLEECLLVQLLVKDDINPKTKNNAERIIREFYDLLRKKHLEEIAKKSEMTLEEVKEAFELIRKLNPKPGEGKFSYNENTIIPDFIVTNEDGELRITMVEGNLPNIRINKKYLSLAKGKNPPEVKEFAKRNLNNAKWFIQAIYQRRRTMMKVMQAIVELQKDFFYEGPSYLKPMVYKDVADMIKVDISTISRAVRNKYVQTDFGTFELKYFFSEKIESSNGEDVSNKKIKQIIKEIIDSEDKKNPFTDDSIAAMLKEKGYNIARRTVAKYREEMNLPVARLRKEI